MIKHFFATLCCLLAMAAARTEAEEGVAEQHWSLKRLQPVAVPMVEALAEARNPVDYFVGARLKMEGMEMSERAAPRELLRRVYFDLIGLPPTPEEMAAFEQDPCAAAYEGVVDRLLSSPRHGERWARHWLDVVHYAETHGHDQDRIRTNAWPYRDYLIAAFNDDKPYARFIEEQIAGDVLYPDDPQAVVGMGFLATGPWDESSMRDIREDTVDRQIARYIDRDDIVMTTMTTFVSLTAQCARCHDHKFDPISQAEYYNLQAVFAATDKANREYDLEPEVHRKRRALRQRKKDLETGVLPAELNSENFRARLAGWERSLGETRTSWKVLVPQSVETKNGATLEIAADGSVLSKGMRPETDTYTAEFLLEGNGVTGFRLEVLRDDGLPKGGPGRQDNGNLHLTDFGVFLIGKGETNEIQIRSASADFNQQDWGIEKAIDDDPKSAWGIYPEVGKSHQTVFELKERLSARGKIRFELKQDHGGGHLIGRFRISSTEAEPPLKIEALPDRIVAILGGSERGEGEQLEMAIYFAKLEAERERAALPEPARVYAGASDFVPDGSFKPAGQPRDVQILRRGDIHRPIGAAKAGALECVEGPEFALENPEDEGARRAALARWISHPENGLTWRSIVNRVWHYHFGRGLVNTPGDLGKMGGEPSHPELLEWLALWFRENGGSFKKLHKLIVMSAVYQQTSRDVPEYRQKDVENKYLWRMNRTRLDAESIRDAMLQASGKIDLKMGGPSAQQFVLSAPIHVTPGVDYSQFDVDAPEGYRRSIYRFIFRTLPDPFMDSLDCPDSSQLTPVRNTSVTVLQALSLMNNRFAVRQSEHLAARLEKRGELAEQVNGAIELLLGREVRAEEGEEMVKFAREHGMANLCRVLFNSNEFMFVH